MHMQRTVKVKVYPPKGRAEQTMREARAIFDMHTAAGKKHGTWNKLKLHRLVYREARDRYPDMPASLVQTVRDQASDALKRERMRGEPKKHRSGIRYNARVFSVRGRNVSFSLCGGRHKEAVHVPEYADALWNTWTPKAANLTHESGTFWLHVVFETETPEKQKEERAIGIDRGMLNLAVTSDGLFFSSKTIRRAQRESLYTKRDLQRKGTRSAARRLTAVSAKEQRRTRDFNHVVSKRISELPANILVLEDLTNIRDRAKRRNRHFRQRFHRWPFRQFATFLEYKAEGRGKRVVYVDARYTSQKCSVCKQKGDRAGSRFSCSCGMRMHADYNAAINIRDNYFSSLLSAKQASVNVPNAPLSGFEQATGLVPVGS